ncbi:MAG: DNA (cytosine-5-)-methyltransferase [Chloroflexota bacterium]
MTNHIRNQQNTLGRSVAEYFAGIGLVRMGLENAGWHIHFANDFSEEKFEMYAAYFKDAKDHYHLKNIFDINQNEVPSTMLATASFPCIDLSLAGKRKGLNGKHSSAFWGFINILEAQGKNRPPIVLLENVTGWISSNQGNDFRLTIQSLNELGYACDVFTLDAIRFTPQSRPRVFIVGYHTEKPNQNVLSLLRRPDSLSNKALRCTIESNFDLNWHINPLPLPPEQSLKNLSQIVELLPDQDPRWWSEKEVDRHLNMMSESHREQIDQLVDQSSLSFRTMYRRVRKGQQRAEVRSDDKAGCLRTARGGSSRQMLVQVGHNHIKMRHMTPREYARLQGVPDDFPIPAKTNQALTGFGDAVCVPAITWIAENVLNPLALELSEGYELAIEDLQQQTAVF